MNPHADPAALDDYLAARDDARRDPIHQLPPTGYSEAAAVAIEKDRLRFEQARRARHEREGRR